MIDRARHFGTKLRTPGAVFVDPTMTCSRVASSPMMRMAWSSTSIRSTTDSMMRLNRELNCLFLLALRSELLEEAPQIFGFLLVLNPRKHHFSARNLRLGIFDVFLEGRFVPDDPGFFVRVRVIVAWDRARLASFQAVLDWADRGFGVFAYVMAGHTFLERFFSRGDISSNGHSRRGRECDNRNRNPLHHSA